MPGHAIASYALLGDDDATLTVDVRDLVAEVFGRDADDTLIVAPPSPPMPDVFEAPTRRMPAVTGIPERHLTRARGAARPLTGPSDTAGLVVAIWSIAIFTWVFLWVLAH